MKKEKAVEMQFCRQKINEIDLQILDLIKQRVLIAKQIGTLKEEQKTKNLVSYYVPEREAEILRTLIQKDEKLFNQKALCAIYRQIISVCRSVEKELSIVVCEQDEAALREAAFFAFGQEVKLIYTANFSEALFTLKTNKADLIVLPIEKEEVRTDIGINTFNKGGYLEALDCLKKIGKDIFVCAEILLMGKNAKGRQRFYVLSKYKTKSTSSDKTLFLINVLDKKMIQFVFSEMAKEKISILFMQSLSSGNNKDKAGKAEEMLLETEGHFEEIKLSKVFEKLKAIKGVEITILGSFPRCIESL